MRVAVLSCSPMTTGELTMALELLTRSRRPMELHALVGPALVTQARGYGATVHTYPPLNPSLAVTKLRPTLAALRPHVLLIADLNLLAGFSPEFSDRLMWVLPEAARFARLAALDLYDYDAHAYRMDAFGGPHLMPPPDIPQGIGRLLPSPSLPPVRSTPGRGRFAMLPNGTPCTPTARARVRAELGVPEGALLVFSTTSAWQHRLKRLPKANAVATHFPTLVMELLSLASARAGFPVHAVHVGPQPLEDLPAHVALHHLPVMERARFGSVLGAADLYLSTNAPASTAVRALTLGVPVATLVVGKNAADTGGPAGTALVRYLDACKGGYPFHMWPLGVSGALTEILRGNPYGEAIGVLDVNQAAHAVEELAVLLGSAAKRAERVALGRACLEAVAQGVDDVDVALSHAVPGWMEAVEP